MLRTGIISEIGKGENLGFARVYFDDRDFVSGWLSLPSTNTKGAKHWVPVAVNSQVACLMDEQCEQGAIVMVLWSAGDAPPSWAGENTYGIQFADGTEIYYDTDSKKLTVNAEGADLNIKCNKLNIDGEVIVTGEVTAGSGKIKLTKHTHTTPSGVSGPPVATPTP